MDEQSGKSKKKWWVEE